MEILPATILILVKSRSNNPLYGIKKKHTLKGRIQYCIKFVLYIFKTSTENLGYNEYLGTKSVCYSRISKKQPGHLQIQNNYTYSCVCIGCKLLLRITIKGDRVEADTK